MKQIYLLIVWLFFCHGISAQIVLTGSPSLSVRTLDSTHLEVNEIKRVTQSDSLLVVLSASDTGLKSSNDSAFDKQNACIISFIGCDETHTVITDFNLFFYSEYAKSYNCETAFIKAKANLLKKYPNSIVTPIIKCVK